MIKRNVTVKLQGSRAVVDSPVYLYQYDKNITLAITLTNNHYQHDDETRLSYTIIKPNGDTVDSGLSAIIQGKYYIALTEDLFNDDVEVGQHLVQIKQYNGNGVISLPPFAIHVLKGYSQPLDTIGDGLLTEEELMLLTENQKAIEVDGTVKISELPTTTNVTGYVPVTQGTTTYKLDMSNVVDKYDLTIELEKKAEKEHEHSQYLTEHQDISHLASQAYVKNEIANAQLGGGETEIDLSGYATKDDLLTKADKEHTHSQYLTQHQDISHLATKAELEHNHDEVYAPKTHTHEQYLTEHQSLEHLALKEHTHNYSPTTHTHSYNDLTNKPTIPSIDGLATETYVNQAIANAQLGGEEVDLTEYALKTDLPTHTSDLTNDSGFITDIPLEYVTESELDAKGYLTSTSITRIEVVDALPSTQEQGVLYIVKAGE